MKSHPFFSRTPARAVAAAVLAVALVFGAAGCSPDNGENTAAVGGGDPQSGGDVTVLLDSGFAGGWDTGLDPAISSTVGANMGQNNALFGGLFVIEADDDGLNGRIVENQAESFEYLDGGKVVQVRLREEITFTDGTPMDADAVLWNWVRALSSKSVAAPRLQLDSSMGVPEDLDPALVADVFAALPDGVEEAEVMERFAAIRKIDDLTVEIRMLNANGALINSFPGTNMNLIASPTAYKKLGGEEFAKSPVAAGPFVVTSNKKSDRLELERNDSYFKEGLPYLDTLSFQSVGGDQVAYQTLQAGQGDAIEGLSAVTLITEAEQNPDVQVTLGVPTSPYVVQLNTRTAPFDDKRAREAIYYATDFEAINEGLFSGNGDMSQSFTAKGGLFHQPEVEGYRTYDPEKAKQLVEEIGGITVELGTTDIVTARSVTTALQTQWAEAGIDVTIKAQPLGDVITKFNSGEWQSMLQTAGAWEPSAGIGVQVRFGSSSPYSGAPLPEGANSAAEATELGLTTELDQMLLDAVANVEEDERAKHYAAAAKLISDEAYGPFGFAFSPAQVASAHVHGPGLTSPIPALAVNSAVLYDRVWTSK